MRLFLPEHRPEVRDQFVHSLVVDVHARVICAR